MPVITKQSKKNTPNTLHNCSPSDYGRHKEAIQRPLRNPNGNRKLIRRKQPKHSGNGLLHGVLGRIRNTLRNNRIVQRLDFLQHAGDNGEFSIEAVGLCSGDEVVGDTSAVDAGDEAGDDRGETALGGGEEGGGGGGKERADEEVVGEGRRRWFD